MTATSTPYIPPRSFRIPTTQSLQKDIDKVAREALLDPVLFAKHYLDIDLWGKQAEIARSVLSNRRTAAKACHASGKTFVAAAITLWFLARWEKSYVITTAPTDRQVGKTLWAEIPALIEKSRYPFPKPITQELFINSKRRAFGFTTNVDSGDEGSKFQGFHNEHVLLIVDEGPGVDSKIWMAVEGILSSGDTRLLTLGNPTISSGTFFDAFGINNATWKNYTISAFDTPNLAGLKLVLNRIDVSGKEREVTYGDSRGRDLRSLSQEELDVNPISYLVSRRWVLERLMEWGPNHPHFVSRVLGEFPSQAPDSLLSLEWLERAKSSSLPAAGKKLQAGLDVAGPGEDETVLCIRDGPKVLHLQAWPQADPRGEVAATLAPYKEKIEVNIDSCGIGYYMARHLEDLGFVVSDVNVGNAPSDREKYSNLKAELYWALRMRLESSEMSGLLDKTAIAQLASIRYKTDPRGRIVIESKDDARKRGVKSPDRAEAIMLAFAPSFQHGLFGFWEELSKSAEEQKKMERIQLNSTQAASTLSTAQKEKAGFPDRYSDYRDPAGQQAPAPDLVNKPVDLSAQKLQEVRNLGKVMVADETPKCPSCGNAHLARYGENTWRCNNCGDSSKNHG